MPFPSNSSAVNTVILLLFLGMWIYTEVTEEVERAAFKQHVESFMVEIEHDRLLERVQKLEEGHGEGGGE